MSAQILEFLNLAPERTEGGRRRHSWSRRRSECRLQVGPGVARAQSLQNPLIKELGILDYDLRYS